MTMDQLLNTAVLSLRQPRLGLRVVLSWNLSLTEAILALLVTAIASAILASSIMVVPPEMDPVSAAILSSPIYLTCAQMAGLTLISIFIHLLGRMAQSQATLAQAVSLMAWAQALWIAFLIVAILTVILLPPLGVILLSVGYVVSTWQQVSFVAELHGFRSLFLTLLGVFAAFVGAMIAAVLILMLLMVLGVLHV